MHTLRPDAPVLEDDANIDITLSSATVTLVAPPESLPLFATAVDVTVLYLLASMLSLGVSKIDVPAVLMVMGVELCRTSMTMADAGSVPSVSLVYDARTPKIFHANGTLNEARGAVEVGTVPVSDVHAIMAVCMSPVVVAVCAAVGLMVGVLEKFVAPESVIELPLTVVAVTLEPNEVAVVLLVPKFVSCSNVRLIACPLRRVPLKLQSAFTSSRCLSPRIVKKGNEPVLAPKNCIRMLVPAV